MASLFIGELMDKVNEQFTDHLNSILMDISEKYEIDMADLEAAYLGEYKPKKASKKKDDDRQKCEAKTAKGTACRNYALVDTKFCQCHTKEKKEKKDKGKEKEEKKEKKEPKKKKTPVVHTHDKDEEEHSDCEACEKVGNSDGAGPSTTQDAKTAISNILAQLESEGESESESELDDEEQRLKEELFGADD